LSTEGHISPHLTGLLHDASQRYIEHVYYIGICNGFVKLKQGKLCNKPII